MSNPSVRVAAATRWILGPSQDLLLFVGSPVMILPLVLIALQGIESEQIQLLVLMFGAMGHNLPGMIRAYGDRALFRRFKTRFILAPIVFGSVCLAFGLRQAWAGQSWAALLLIALLWASWHALMQVYGFLRIYDAKVGAVTPRIARLDLAMVIAWFGGAMVLSDARVYHVQEILIDFGISPIGTGSLGALRLAVAVLIAGVTVAYVVSQVLQRRSGTRVNPVKNLLMFTSIGFWWFAHFLTDDVLLGLIMFEIFHDVQYLAIVWVFNRRRVGTDPNVGGFTRFLFRNSWGMVGIYIGLVLAYGGMIPIYTQFELSYTAVMVGESVILTSALLHYYFDGFIWKVREQSTRKSLGVDDESGSEDTRVPRHALKWLLFLVPCAVLWTLGETAPTPLKKAEALADSTPHSSRAQFQLGYALRVVGRHLDSLPALTRSLEILPDNQEARDNLLRAQLEAGKDLWRKNERQRAEVLLRKVYARIPEFVVVHTNDLGLRRWKEGKLDEAIVQFQVLLLVKPDMAAAHLNLASVYRDADQLTLALQHAKRGAALEPDDQRAQELVRSLQDR